MHIRAEYDLSPLDLLISEVKSPGGGGQDVNLFPPKNYLKGSLQVLKYKSKRHLCA